MTAGDVEQIHRMADGLLESWLKRDEQYRRRPAPLSVAEEESIRLWRLREALSVPQPETGNLIERLRDWRPPRRA